MKPNKIIEPWKGDKRWTTMATRAAKLKKSGMSVEQITAAISEEFGPPPQIEQISATPQPYMVVGEIGSDIEQAAVAQLELALRLPIAVRGALMPDAHPGYALPIGGVFAAHNAVAPAMVGVDIGCRMHLTIFTEPAEDVLARRAELFAELQGVTVFGAGGTRAKPADHAILDDARWGMTAQTRDLRTKAARQLGTSGSGNHFAELIVGEALPGASTLNLPGQFCGLLTHSGSRGVGYAIANHYIRLAQAETERRARVPRMYEWLDLAGEAGQEYWQAMELAGAFARANHEVIHDTFARRAKLTALMVVQNHHNFAWRMGALVIHRKGATPAGDGELGIIPGSMATPSYLVAGRGSEQALWSASHGAGRVGSRSQARSRSTLAEARRTMAQAHILVEGLSVDEAPHAYKNIERVIQLQVEAGLITPLAKMRPIAVIMAGEEGDE